MNYKKLIVDSGKRMYNSGLTIATWGNLSVRDEKTGKIYLTPSAMKYNIIKESDVVVCDKNGNIIEGKRKPTIEKDMHLLIYKNRKDVNAVIHTHPLYSMVYAAQGKNIPLCLDEAVQVLGDVCKCTKHALPGSIKLAESVTKALGKDAMSCLIHSHGAVCVGKDMDFAFKVSQVLEYTAQVLYMIESTGGKPQGINAKDAAYMQNFAKYKYGQR